MDVSWEDYDGKKREEGVTLKSEGWRWKLQKFLTFIFVFPSIKVVFAVEEGSKARLPMFPKIPLSW